MISVGVIGAGTMGSGIAQGAAVHGHRVVLFDQAPAAVARALGKITDSLDRAVAKGKMTAAAAGAARGRITGADSLAGLAGCGLAIEAIVEDAAAKAALFSALSRVVAADAVIATNTSSLRVGELAEAVCEPERFLGLHYFFPAAVNPLIEVVRGPATGATAVDTASTFARACGKTPIVCADQYGFAVNRFFVPYLNEAARLAGEGYSLGAIDAAARAAFQTAAGPFKVMDMSKPAIALHACRTLARLGRFYEPAPILVRVGESGALWQPDDTTQPGADGALIRDRLQGAVLTAVGELLAEGVATQEAIDTGAKLGLQWGWRPCRENGGPVTTTP